MLERIQLVRQVVEVRYFWIENLFSYIHIYIYVYSSNYYRKYDILWCKLKIMSTYFLVKDDSSNLN